MRRALLILLALMLVGAALLIGWRFNRDMALARSHAAQGSVLLPTRCGPIEVQQAGTGVPLLVVHGARADGLRSDTALGKHLAPAPLESIHTPTLIIRARDDRYGTYASAQFTASRIAGAKFVRFDQGGHTWVGHDDEVRAEIVRLLVTPDPP